MAMTPTLLITDDDPAMRQTLSDVFAGTGISTLLASDGQEAIELLERNAIHVGLFDLQMPRIDGMQAIEHVRRRGLALPCILMSGALSDEVIARADAHQVFSVLAKPFRISTVARLVRDALARFHGWPPS
jgi:CheY-like chemotaxis protein